MSKIAIIATLTAAEGKEAELESALSEMVGKVEAEPGALIYSLNRKKDSAGTFVFFEVYEDADALAAHGQTDHMKEFQGKLAGLLGGRPEIIRLDPIVAKGI